MNSKYSNILKILTKDIKGGDSLEIKNNLHIFERECKIIEVYFKKYLEIVEDKELLTDMKKEILQKIGCNKKPFSEEEAEHLYNALNLNPLRNQRAGGPVINAVREKLKINPDRDLRRPGSNPTVAEHADSAEPRQSAVDLGENSGDGADDSSDSDDEHEGNGSDGAHSLDEQGASPSLSIDPVATHHIDIIGEVIAAAPPRIVITGEVVNVKPSGGGQAVVVEVPSSGAAHQGSIVSGGIDVKVPTLPGASVDILSALPVGDAVLPGASADILAALPLDDATLPIAALAHPYTEAKTAIDDRFLTALTGGPVTPSGHKWDGSGNTICLSDIPSILLSKIGLPSMPVSNLLKLLTCQLNNFKSYDFPRNISCDWVYFSLVLLSLIPFLNIIPNYILLFRAIINQQYFLAIMLIITNIMNVFVLNTVDLGWIFKVFYYLDSISHQNHSKENNCSWTGSLGIRHKVITSDGTEKNCINDIWAGGIAAAREELNDKLKFGTYDISNGERNVNPDSLKTTIGGTDYLLPENWWKLPNPVPDKNCTGNTGGPVEAMRRPSADGDSGKQALAPGGDGVTIAPGGGNKPPAVAPVGVNPNPDGGDGVNITPGGDDGSDPSKRLLAPGGGSGRRIAVVPRPFRISLGDNPIEAIRARLLEGIKLPSYLVDAELSESTDDSSDEELPDVYAGLYDCDDVLIPLTDILNLRESRVSGRLVSKL